MRLAVIGLLVLAAAVLASDDEDEAPGTFDAKPGLGSCPWGRVLGIGDSFMVGLSAVGLKGALGCGADFEAKTSTTTAFWVQRIKSGLLANHETPDTIFVSLGTNDGGAVDAAASELVELLQTRFPQAVIIWLVPPQGPNTPAAVRPGGAAWNSFAKVIAGFFRTDELDIPMAPDGLHPSVEGYARWAKALLGM